VCHREIGTWRQLKETWREIVIKSSLCPSFNFITERFWDKQFILHYWDLAFLYHSYHVNLYVWSSWSRANSNLRLSVWFISNLTIIHYIVRRDKNVIDPNLRDSLHCSTFSYWPQGTFHTVPGNWNFCPAVILNMTTDCHNGFLPFISSLAN